MREILFRGKSNWTYGNVKEGDWLYSMTISRHCYNDEEITSYYIGGGNKTIDGKTLGQYTGLLDKNGKKIFEGDIVKFCDIKGVINYGMGCYCVKTNKPDWKSRNNPAIDIVLNEYENELEVIGNIHDNPELLKGGAANGN